ncbi:MAG: hypothetical protein WBC21_03560 [Minisyncoccales bacterium]
MPVEEPIEVTTIEGSIPEQVYPGDVFTLSYEVKNNNENSSYEMTNTFSGNWEVVKQCSISVVSTEEPAVKKVLFQKTFTTNDTITEEITSNEQLMAITADGAGIETYNNYCVVPYSIPAGATCRLEATIKIRNDAPTEENYESWYFNYYLHTYRGRDETPYWDGGMG